MGNYEKYTTEAYKFAELLNKKYNITNEEIKSICSFLKAIKLINHKYEAIPLCRFSDGNDQGCEDFVMNIFKNNGKWDIYFNDEGRRYYLSTNNDIDTAIIKLISNVPFEYGDEIDFDGMYDKDVKTLLAGYKATMNKLELFSPDNTARTNFNMCSAVYRLYSKANGVVSKALNIEIESNIKSK